jgi:phage regulator Rha-like protein
MTNSIVSASVLEISDLDGELVVDSRLIAVDLNIQHETVIKNIRKYADKFQSMGNLRFEIGKLEKGSTGRPEQFVYLNELQSNFLMTLSKNTEAVVECKFNLSIAFDKAKTIIKTVIPVQNDRIRELELENENLKLRGKESDRQDTRIALHGLATTLLLEGKSDAVVEIEKPTLEVIDQRNNTSYSGQTLTQIKDFLVKKHGIKFKTGADIKRVLEQKGLGHLIAQTPRSVLSDYVPTENQQSVYDALVGTPNRQMLLGE